MHAHLLSQKLDLQNKIIHYLLFVPRDKLMKIDSDMKPEKYITVKRKNGAGFRFLTITLSAGHTAMFTKF